MTYNQAEELYNFFKDFSEESKGIVRTFSRLYAEWYIEEAKLHDMLDKLGELMGQ